MWADAAGDDGDSVDVGTVVVDASVVWCGFFGDPRVYGNKGEVIVMMATRRKHMNRTGRCQKPTHSHDVRVRYAIPRSVRCKGILEGS